MTWPVVPLGDVAETALGKMLDRGKSKGHAHVPYLRNVNVQWGRIDTHDLLTMELADDERDRFAVQEGDLLVCEGGEIGRCAVWRGRSEYLAYQKALHRVRPSDRLDARFLRYILEHHAQTGGLARLATGSTIAHLPQQQLRRVRVPLPPLDEQHRIVDLLEDHLSRLDAATLDLQHAAQRARSLFESSVLRMFQKNSGRETTLGRIATWGSGGTPSARNAAYYLGGTIPWVNSGDLADGPVSGAPKKISEQGLRASSAKWVPEGSVLVAMYGATIGKTGFTTSPVTTNQAIAFATPSSAVAGSWLQWFLRSQGPLLRKAGKGGAQPNISQTILKDWPLSLPSLEVQNAQVQSAAALEAHLLRLHAAVTSAQNRAVALRLSLLAAAFSGRLTGATSDVSDTEMIEEFAGV